MQSSGRQRMETPAFLASVIAPRMRVALPSQSRGVWLRTAAATRINLMLQSYTAQKLLAGTKPGPGAAQVDAGLANHREQICSRLQATYCGAVRDWPLSLGPRLRRNRTAFFAHFSGVGYEA